MTTTTPTTTRFAVLRPIGGSPRAQVCGVYATHLGASRHLSPGRTVGVVPAGTEPLANVALTSVREHLAAEALRVAGAVVYVSIFGDTTAAGEAVLVALEALPDGAGFDAIAERLRA